MAMTGSLNRSHKWGIHKNQRYNKQFEELNLSNRLHIVPASLSSLASRQDSLSLKLSTRLQQAFTTAPNRPNLLKCNCALNPAQAFGSAAVKNVALAISNALQGKPIIQKLIPAVGILVFAVWGLGPLMRRSRTIFLHKNDGSWGKSSTYYVMTSYLQPLMLWTGAMLICRALDPVVLPSEASQIVKIRLLTFVKSLSTVLALAYCLSRYKEWHHLRVWLSHLLFNVTPVANGEKYPKSILKISEVTIQKIHLFAPNSPKQPVRNLLISTITNHLKFGLWINPISQKPQRVLKE